MGTKLRKVGQSTKFSTYFSLYSCSVGKVHADSLALNQRTIRGQTVGYPDITANHRMMAYRDATQHRAVRINRHIVFQDGMAGHALRLAFVVNLEILRTQRNALIQCDMIADDAGFANHHASAVVYREILAYLSTRMNVDTRSRMSLLRDDSRNDGHTHPMA